MEILISSSSFHRKLFLFVVICCALSPSSFVITMSVFKSTGSENFGILPEKIAKVTHQALPPPSDEGYRFLSQAFYYFNQAENHIYNAFKQVFGTSDNEDPQIYQGVYKCKKGVCKMLPLDDQQTSIFHENLKGKKIRTGNALTTKVKQLEERNQPHH